MVTKLLEPIYGFTEASGSAAAARSTRTVAPSNGTIAGEDFVSAETFGRRFSDDAAKLSDFARSG
jgi:hypothetical protein